MKFLILASFLLAAPLSFAEVKPNGTLVATQCGTNDLETPVALNSPTRICLYSVVGAGQDTVLIGVETAGGIKYYKLNEIEADQGDQVIWKVARVVVKKSKPYTLLDSSVAADTGDGFELTLVSQGGQPFLASGPMFEVSLQLMAHTE